jgi:GxxExxY protein
MKTPEESRALTEAIIGAAIEVHRTLGPGLLESAYAVCLSYELAQKNIPFRTQVDLPLSYKGVKLDCGYRLDMIVAQQVVVELKAVEQVTPIHEAQLLTYLRLSGYRVGLILNFNVAMMRDGIHRRVV